MSENTLLLIEPYYGGSHRQFVDTIIHGLSKGPGGAKSHNTVCFISLPAKKWHWRARTSALYISQIIPQPSQFKVLFASSVLNLAELVALRPDLANVRKIIYFHENQLLYPVQDIKMRDFQYGYNQILSCLVADLVLFNSNFNKNSFLNNIKRFMDIQPDFKPKNLKEQIEGKCRVLYFPVHFPMVSMSRKDPCTLHIVWPHRREHDKNPELFFATLQTLAVRGKRFKFSVLGETFAEEPPAFQRAKEVLEDYVAHWGYVESKEAYYCLLKEGHVVVSTSRQEFFGVAMLEATYCGCFPICPNNLVYPEIYPKECLYVDDTDLLSKLSRFCDNPATAVAARELMNMDLTQYSVDYLIPKYKNLIFFD